MNINPSVVRPRSRYWGRNQPPITTDWIKPRPQYYDPFEKIMQDETPYDDLYSNSKLQLEGYEYKVIDYKYHLNKGINVVSLLLSACILAPIFLLIFDTNIFSKSLQLRKKNSSILNISLYAMIILISSIVIVSSFSLYFGPRYWTNVFAIIFSLLFIVALIFFMYEAFKYGNEGTDTIALVSVLALYGFVMLIMFIVNISY